MYFIGAIIEGNYFIYMVYAYTSYIISVTLTTKLLDVVILPHEVWHMANHNVHVRCDIFFVISITLLANL